MIRIGPIAFVFVVGVTIVSAQQRPPLISPSDPPPQRQAPMPTFRATVSTVEVDAIATDSQGNPVRGLTKDDFQLFEDGKRQAITTFSAVDLPMPMTPAPAPPASPVSNAAAVPIADVASNARPFEGRLYAMVIDDLHLPTERVARLRAVARQFVQQDLGPGDRMAIVHAQGTQAGNQEFTGDKEKLLEAIDSASSYSMAPSPEADSYGVDAESAEDARAAYDTLRAVADWFARVHNRRKAILFVSEGINYDINKVAPNHLTDAWANVNAAVGPPVTHYADLVTAATQDAIRAAMRNDVAIYGIDPVGLASASGLAPASLQTLSDETGGFATVNQNDFSAPYRRIVADNSAYYVLAYTPPNEKRDDKLHKIAIKVDRPGVTVRARRGYAAAPAVAAVAGIGGSPEIREILGSPVPVSGLTLDAFAAPFASASGTPSVLVGAELRGRDLPLTPGDRIEIGYLAIGADGHTQAGHANTITLDVTPETKARIQQSGLRVLNRVALPPGRYQVRVAARDADGRAGSALDDLVVPDFAGAPLVLSGIALTSTTASLMATVQPDDALKAVMPAQPSGLRAFPQGDTVALYAEAYEGAGAAGKIDFTATVADASGKTVFKASDVRDATALQPNALDKAGFSTRLSMAKLGPGSYVLTVTAQPEPGGTPVTRQIPFEVVAGGR